MFFRARTSFLPYFCKQDNLSSQRRFCAFVFLYSQPHDLILSEQVMELDIYGTSVATDVVLSEK